MRFAQQDLFPPSQGVLPHRVETLERFPWCSGWDLVFLSPLMRGGRVGMSIQSRVWDGGKELPPGAENRPGIVEFGLGKITEPNCSLTKLCPQGPPSNPHR